LVNERSPERVELAMLTAAAARFVAAERAGAVMGDHGDGHAVTPRWGLLGRAERLRRRLT
jgi:hypothetical protein